MTDEADGRWIVETVTEAQGFRTALAASGPVTTVEGVHDLVLFDNAAFGRVMVLDGAIQLTTADEFIYHEAMAHVGLLAHGDVRRVLIIGGGDGGIAREVLRHPCVEAVTLVEIDRAVIDLAAAHLPQVSAGAFDDPRLAIVIEDGARFVSRTEARFDAVIVDSPDPIGPGAALFGRDFYQCCSGLLADGGVMITQSGMPFLNQDWFARHASDLAAVFPARRFFLTTVPTYTGGPMAHGFATHDPAVFSVSEEALAARLAAAGFAPFYWTPEVHRAAFALPGYIARLVGDGRAAAA